MGRIRSIKPEFFKHEAMFDLEQETGLPVRLAFIALWTCCDKAGRFRWRPRTLKSDCLPFDDVDFSRVLDALTTRGFVVRYTVGRDEFGCIPTFAKHQYINNRETESDLPPPPAIISYDADLAEETTRAPRVPHASEKLQSRARANREGEGEGEKKEGGGVDAREAPVAPTFRERILAAMGRDESGLDALGRQAGSRAEMIEAEKWITDLGLTEDDVVAVVSEVTAKMAKRGNPPSSFRFFTSDMQRLAGIKAQGALQPAITQPREPVNVTPFNGGQNGHGRASSRSRAQFDEAHREYVRRVAAGEIDRGPDPSDPFAG